MYFSQALAVMALSYATAHGAALTQVSSYGGKATSKAQMQVPLFPG